MLVNPSTSTDRRFFLALFASTSATDGAKVFKKCVACHSIAEVGGNKIGPALWGVLGRKAGSVSDYKYSKAMKKSDIVWNEVTLDKFLKSPKKYLKGTKMRIKGLKRNQRDAIIEYLRKNQK